MSDPRDVHLSEFEAEVKSHVRILRRQRLLEEERERRRAELERLAAEAPRVARLPPLAGGEPRPKQRVSSICAIPLASPL